MDQILVQIWQQITSFITSPVGGVVLTVLGVLGTIAGAYYGYRQVKLTQETKAFQQEANALQFAVQRSKFPFDLNSVDDLREPRILQRLLLANADIRYVRRLPEEQHQQMIDEWKEALNHPENPRLLIRGVTGLGKTREVVEFLKIMQQELPEGKTLTILMPRPDMDVPQELPDDLPLENLVLFVSDLHLRYQEGQRASAVRPGIESEHFHVRFQRVVAFFEEKTKGYGPFRVIATVRSEPELWERISPNNPFWETFTIFDLARLHSSQVTNLIDAVVEKLGNISVDHDASDVLTERNDGTFGSIVLYLTTEKALGNTNINGEMARQSFTGVYRKDWESRTYADFIKPFPARVLILSALNILDQAGIPFWKEVVLELAACLWHVWQPVWWRRRKIQKALIALQPWIQESEGLLTCPEAYFENRGNLDKEVSTVTLTLLRMTQDRQLQRVLFNPLFNFGLLLAGKFCEEQARRVFAMLVKLNPTSGATRFEHSYLLFWEGYLQKAEREVNRAILLDPSEPRYHVVHADSLSLRAKFAAASPHYKAALRLTTRLDANAPWILFEYADYLLTLGIRDEAIAYLTQLLDLSPDYVSARCVFAIDLIDKGEKEKAIEQVNLALETRPWSPTGYNNLGAVHRKLGIPRTAIEFYSKAIEMGRGNPISCGGAYLERALCYIELNQQASAQKDLLKAREAFSILTRRCSNHYSAVYSLAFTYLALGDTKKAIKTLKKAQQICPLPSVFDDWAQESRRLSTIAPTLAGITEFLHVLEHPQETAQWRILDIRNFVRTFKPAEFSEARLGRRIEQKVSMAKQLLMLHVQAQRMQKTLQSKTVTAQAVDPGCNARTGGT